MAATFIKGDRVVLTIRGQKSYRRDRTGGYKGTVTTTPRNHVQVTVRRDGNKYASVFHVSWWVRVGNRAQEELESFASPLKAKYD